MYFFNGSRQIYGLICIYFIELFYLMIDGIDGKGGQSPPMRNEEIRVRFCQIQYKSGKK